MKLPDKTRLPKPLRNLLGIKTPRCQWPEHLTDYHSHLLPAVDDGSHSMDQTLAMLHRLERRGWTTLWLTPHVMEDLTNTPATLRQSFDTLSQAYNGPIKLHLGAEYMLDSKFEHQITHHSPLTLPGNRLLVETSYFDAPKSLFETLEWVIKQGYTPLLAHPERYRYMDRGHYEKLHKMGVEMQLNILSLISHYGEAARQCALYMLAAGYYNVVGTDIHHHGHITLLDDVFHHPRTAELLQSIHPK